MRSSIGRVLREAIHDLNRLREVSSVIARHGFGAYLERVRLGSAALPGRAPGAGLEAAPPPPSDGRNAARFRQMLVDLGPTFVKLGQLLSSRPDILPARLDRGALRRSRTPARPCPSPRIRRQIERGLGRPVDELFAWLDPVPAGQRLHRPGPPGAHPRRRARWRSRCSAPASASSSRPTWASCSTWPGCSRRVVEETGVYTPTDIVEEFDRAIHEELDFANEARNARDMATASRGLRLRRHPRRPRRPLLRDRAHPRLRRGASR